MEIEHVHLRKDKELPEDFVGESEFTDKYLGQLIRPDGTFYSRLDRRKYCDPMEKNHIAKTPLHCARWAIQEFTKEDDWVLDPTMGAGTTAVESLRLGRNVAGVELEAESLKVIQANVARNNIHDKEYRIECRDARDIAPVIGDLSFSLVVNNPPYSGDANQSGFSGKGRFYDKEFPNLAFLNEGEEYIKTMGEIYSVCKNHLSAGGYFVVGVKDMMRNKKPFLLHRLLGHILVNIGLKFQGTVLLKHHPGTLHLNTYEKRWGINLPRYQTILVFRKAS
jgi:DNA modification methylase